MARETRMAAVAEIADKFRSSSGAVLTEYRGLTVKQLTELRRSLGANASYAVVKNTLTKRAAAEAGIEGMDDLLVGPSAIAFITGDAVETAKGLRDFAKAHPLLVIKGGVLDGRPVSPDEIKKLADLESREVLLAKLAGAMKASLQNAVSLFNAPLAQTARALGALQAKAEQDPSVLAGGAAAAAPVADEAPAAADEVEVAEATDAPTADVTESTQSTESAEAAVEAEASTEEADASAAEETPEG